MHPRQAALAALLALTLSSAAQAHVAYNLSGYDSTGTGGVDGALPGSWIGGGAPYNYAGDMDIMWFMEFHNANSSHTVSTADAIAKGAANDYALAVGPKGWNKPSLGIPNTGSFHGLDYGLVHLEEAANLTINVTAAVAGLIPAFSFYAGWDSGGTWDRLANYTNNISNPAGTEGLTQIGRAFATTGGTTISLDMGTLAAGDYTLIIGGNNGTTAGKYSATLVAAPVPEPATYGMFAAGLLVLMLSGARRRR
jgi:hypothetical protein